jgi:hypothetical protein
MGAWNAKSFGNDSANDWVFELEKCVGASVLEGALEAALKDSKPESEACERALGAAAVVEASRKNPIGRFPTAARDWVLETSFVASNRLVALAIRGVRKIRNESELLELWKEAGAAKWLKEMDVLLESLRLLENASRRRSYGRIPHSSSPRRKGLSPSNVRALSGALNASRCGQRTRQRDEFYQTRSAHG